MKFLADLHIHSKYSLAASKNLDIENLYKAARMKGITVLGTGDFTHPGWFSEINEKLIPSEEGLYKLKKNISKRLDNSIPEACKGTTRFILSCELCSIFKKKGRVRKIHSIVLMPEINSVEKICMKLEKRCKTESTGRPVLSFDVTDLLSMILEISDKAALIPAHIWTPWYSLFGSKSGFDSVEECFGKLSEYIFAAETGLSSDPAMCRNFSGLDKITLISNSDAHSPLKIGREANIFDTSLSYDSIISALKSGNSKEFIGTVEYYPEEGKYYADGHRLCGYSRLPGESAKNGEICPVCGKQVTIGVLNRIMALSDKPGNKAITTQSYKTIPLLEILSEIYRMNPDSKKIMTCYKNLLEQFGPELHILNRINMDEIRNSGIPLLAEAIGRMRENKVTISPGFDGKYGKLKIFSEEEIKRANIP
jgi:DNA helicase II / ATP-dependent DNA helicase PcrA